MSSYIVGATLINYLLCYHFINFGLGVNAQIDDCLLFIVARVRPSEYVLVICIIEASISNYGFSPKSSSPIIQSDAFYLSGPINKD